MEPTEKTQPEPESVSQKEQSSSDTATPAPASGTMASIERAFLRLTFWQTLLSLAGVFTGVVALYAALGESQAVRQQTAASVWPYVQAMIHDSRDDDSASLRLVLHNVGVGPARMQGMQVKVNGEAARDWAAVTSLLLGREAEVGVEYGQTSVSRRVLAPGESVDALQTEAAELAVKLQDAIYSGTVTLTYCYCSIFDQCWRKASAEVSSDEQVEPVEQCPDYGEAGFLN